MSDFKLGKRAGRVHDPRSIRLPQILDTATLPPIPKSWRIAANLHTWGMFGNNLIGCCTCASLLGHRVQAQEYSAGQHEPLHVTDGQVIAVYSAITGYDPAKPSTDTGAYLLDVLRYVRSHGYGKEADKTPHTIEAYAQLTPRNDGNTRRAAHLFGGLYIGAGLPASAAGEINAGQPWTATTDEPYSWGGHAIWMVAYDAKGVTFVTWGREQKATWAWFAKYVDESWVVVSEDFLTRNRWTPQGLDVATLEGLLAQLK